MKRIVSTLIIMVAFAFLLAGCKSRNKLISGTYIHNADDDFCEVIIVHDGNDVSVKIDGKEYDAKMEQENEILVNGQYEILETYCDENGNPDIENCVKDSIKILNASEWIEGDFEVDKDGNVNLILDKQ